MNTLASALRTDLLDPTHIVGAAVWGCRLLPDFGPTGRVGPPLRAQNGSAPIGRNRPSLCERVCSSARIRRQLSSVCAPRARTAGAGHRTPDRRQRCVRCPGPRGTEYARQSCGRRVAGALSSHSRGRQGTVELSQGRRYEPWSRFRWATRCFAMNKGGSEVIVPNSVMASSVIIRVETRRSSSHSATAYELAAGGPPLFEPAMRSVSLMSSLHRPACACTFAPDRYVGRDRRRARAATAINRVRPLSRAIRECNAHARRMDALSGLHRPARDDARSPVRTVVRSWSTQLLEAGPIDVRDVVVFPARSRLASGNYSRFARRSP